MEYDSIHACIESVLKHKILNPQRVRFTYWKKLKKRDVVPHSYSYFYDVRLLKKDFVINTTMNIKKEELNLMKITNGFNIFIKIEMLEEKYGPQLSLKKKEEMHIVNLHSVEIFPRL